MTQNTPTPTSPAAGQGSWYAGHSAGGHHGIVACERSGRTVALVYDPDDTPLLAASEELLDAAKSLLNCHTGASWQTEEIRNKAFRCLGNAVAKAEGR